MNMFSTAFVALVVISLIVYYLVPKKMQWLVLLLTSLIFYAAAGPKYFIYIIFTVVTTFVLSHIMENKRVELSELGKKRNVIKQELRKFVTLGVVANLSILFFLKYIPELPNILGGFGIKNDFTNGIKALNIILPLGISFYTFQSVGYLVDVYRGAVKPEKSIFRYTLFISYFPQIIQGPISRFNDLGTQFRKEHDFDFEKIKSGLLLVTFGLFKKIVIADRSAVLVNTIFKPDSGYEGLVLFFGATMYCVQIYGDFSGGIDIIRGVSKMFSIDLVDNFKRPYFSKSVSEFWKRWHITLGSWMKDYVFYPIALSKPLGKLSRKTRKVFGSHIGKQLPPAVASLIVFTFVGMWHGASFKFVMYGLFNGVFVLSEPLLRPFYDKVLKFFKFDVNTTTFQVFQILRTFFIVTIGRFFSRAGSFTQSREMIHSTFTDFNPWVLFDDTLYRLGLEQKEIKVLIFSLIVLFCISFAQEKGVNMEQWLKDQHIIFRWSLIIGFILFIVVYGYYGYSTSISNFIYQGF